MGVDETARLNVSISQALEYKFASVPQFMAIMETLGYECFLAKDEVVLKRGGVTQDRVPKSMIENRCRTTGQIDKKRVAQLRAILRKYRDMSSGRKELQELMRSKFGVGLLFLGPKDAPTGYMVIDHKTKSVFKGSDICKLKELLLFMSREERFNKIDAFIDEMLEDNNDLTTKDLNKLLQRQFHSKILKGTVLCNGSTYQLSEHVMTTLRSNDRRAWLQSFHPSSEQERDFLCKMGKFSHPEKIELEKKDEEKTRTTVASLSRIFQETPDENLMEKIHEDGYMVAFVEDNTYCIDFENHTVINLAEYGLDAARLRKKPEESKDNVILNVNARGVGRNIGKLVNQRGGSSDGNREWEVGSTGNYDDIDYEQRLKR